MTHWWERFEKEAIFYVTPDVKRGIGFGGILPNYHIICSFFDPIIPILRKQGTNIFCLEELKKEDSIKISNSGKLLEHKLVSDYIRRYSFSVPYIIYFKPSLKLDILIKKKGYLPIGNSTKLNEEFENKINFASFVQRYFLQFAIPSELGILGNLNFRKLADKLGLPFVVQFGRGWAGKTTFFIRSEREFKTLCQRFSHTKVVVSSRINGFTVLNNCCIYNSLVSISPPAIQLSDIRKLHSKPGVTCGRQWPVKFLSFKQEKTIYDISQRIGRLMKKSGYNGFFGLDFLIESDNGRVYLSEVNARLTASASFYTRLEQGIGNIPLLAYHLAAFLGKSLPFLKTVSSSIIGSQIIFRSKLPKVQLLSVDFGVFRIKNSQLSLIREDYFPERLKSDEFIFMQRLKKDKKRNDKELARIETKKEALEKPGKLKFWLSSLL